MIRFDASQLVIDFVQLKSITTSLGGSMSIIDDAASTPDEEVTKQAERAADEIVEDARAREREIRLGAEDYADEILNTLEVNLQKFTAAVQRGRDRLAGRDEEPLGELEE